MEVPVTLLNIDLVSSNPFDIIGARFDSWNAAWVQRDKKIVFDLLNVRFGSSAALQHRTSSTAAVACKPVVPRRLFKNQNLNVCFSR